MPLVKSPSDAAFKSNLKAELAAGKPRDQSLAIAYSVKRRAKKRRRGGLVRYAEGGAVALDAPSEPEMRSYQPSVRDRIANFLMGDERATSPRGHFVRGMLGTTGLGNPQLSAVDAVPGVGAGLMAQEAAQSDKPGEALGYGVAAALPFGRHIASAVSAAPKAIAGLGGVLGGVLGSTDTAESQRLTNAQKRQVEMDRQRMEMGTSAARQRGLDESAAKQSALESQQKLELERERIANERRITEEKRIAEAPFRDRYPQLANYISGAGIAMSALLPYGARLAKSMGANSTMRAWDATATKAEQAILDGNLKQANMHVAQLAEFKKMGDKAKPQSMGAATWAAGAASPLELAMLPEQIDLMTGSPEAKKKAEDALLDWHRLPAALAQGATFATIGSKVPVPSRTSPAARSEGIVKSYKSSSRKPPPSRKPKKEKEPEVDDTNVTPLRKADGHARGGAALHVAYRVKRASGGSVHVGPINSTVPGRTDHHPIKVPAGSYIVNADTVSHLGQNNSVAGHAILSQMFGKGRASGGSASDSGDGVDIAAAGGEFVIDPDTVREIGGGDIDHGHRVLDKWMGQMRKDHIRTLKRLPGPAKD